MYDIMLMINSATSDHIRQTNMAILKGTNQTNAMIV